MALYKFIVSLVAAGGGTTLALLAVRQLTLELRILIGIGTFLGIVITAPAAWDAVEDLVSRAQKLREQSVHEPILVDVNNPALTRPWDVIDNEADSLEVIRQKVTRQQEKLDALRAYFRAYRRLPAGAHAYVRDSIVWKECPYDLVAPSIQTAWCLH